MSIGILSITSQSIMMTTEICTDDSRMKQKFAEVYNCPYAYGPNSVQVPFERFNKFTGESRKRIWIFAARSGL